MSLAQSSCQITNLSDFVYDSNGDNAEDITALHLYLYVVRNTTWAIPTIQRLCQA